MTDPRIVSDPRHDPEDATFVRDSIGLFNVGVTGDSYYSPLAIFLRDERGAVLGGPVGGGAVPRAGIRGKATQGRQRRSQDAGMPRCLPDDLQLPGTRVLRKVRL